MDLNPSFFILPKMKRKKELKIFLDKQYNLYNNPSFIDKDPISIPHSFTKKQDIEISGFWTAILSWGQRVTIINKANQLMDLMGRSPYDFILNHKEKDRKPFLEFKHRTFNAEDSLYFLEWLQQFYRSNKTLEKAFMIDQKKNSFDMQKALGNFHSQFFSLPDYPHRTRKHISNPMKNSSAKRLNMFLRWMVRQDKSGVDFGIWKKIPSSALHIPLDVHVHKIALQLKLTSRKQTDWKTVVEITDNLKELDPNDPAKYDYALFGLGVLGKDAILY